MGVEPLPRACGPGGAGFLLQARECARETGQEAKRLGPGFCLFDRVLPRMALILASGGSPSVQEEQKKPGLFQGRLMSALADKLGSVDLGKVGRDGAGVKEGGRPSK